MCETQEQTNKQSNIFNKRVAMVLRSNLYTVNAAILHIFEFFFIMVQLTQDDQLIMRN